MKSIGITGVTGFIGQEVARQAAAAGFEVTGFSRSAGRSVGKSVVSQWRKFSFSEPIDASGLDAVVHLAGESILGYWTAKKKSQIRESRISGTRRVVEGIAATADRPIVLVSGSAIGYYGDTGDREVTESSPAGRGFLAEVAQAWEAEALLAASARVVLLRTGFVLGRGAGAMRLIGPVFRAGLGGNLGNGKQWMSPVHVEDVAGMVLHAIQSQALSGPLNAVIPTPVRNSEFTREAGRAAGRPAILPAPAFAIRGVLGELSQLLLESQRVIPAVADQSGYAFRFKDLRTALTDVFLR